MNTESTVSCNNFAKVYGLSPGTKRNVHTNRVSILSGCPLSVSYTAQECDNVITPYYPISVVLSIKWSLTGS